MNQTTLFAAFCVKFVKSIAATPGKTIALQN